MDHTQIEEMKKKAEQARFQRQKQRKVYGSSKFRDEHDNFNSDQSISDEDYDEKIQTEKSFKKRQRFNKNIEKNEEELKVNKLKNQVGYFGYELEPLNMQNEREKGKIDEDGYYQSHKIDKGDIDPWLQQIDQQQKNEVKEMLKNRKTQGVFTDDEESSEEEVQIKKKVKTDEPKNQRKEMFLNAPVFMLQQKLTMLLDENTTVNQQLQKLQSIFKSTQPANKPTFKKNIRKKDRELLEQQALEAQKNQPTQEEKENAQNQFDMIVEMADSILQKSGDGSIYTQTKEQIEINLKKAMEKEDLSSSENSDSNSDNSDNSNSDSESENEDKKKKEHNSSDDEGEESDNSEEKEKIKQEKKQKKLEEKQQKIKEKQVKFAMPSKKPIEKKQDIDLNSKNKEDQVDDDDDIFA